MVLFACLITKRLRQTVAVVVLKPLEQIGNVLGSYS